jgi:hypothetical protein
MDGAAALHLINVALRRVGATFDTTCSGCAINNSTGWNKTGKDVGGISRSSCRRKGSCNNGESEEGRDDKESEFGEHFSSECGCG